MVDGYSKAEASRLNYLRDHQADLRVDGGVKRAQINLAGRQVAQLRMRSPLFACRYEHVCGDPTVALQYECVPARGGAGSETRNTQT